MLPATPFPCPPMEVGGRLEAMAIGPHPLAAGYQHSFQSVEIGKGVVGDRLVEQAPDALDRLQVG